MTIVQAHKERFDTWYPLTPEGQTILTHAAAHPADAAHIARAAHLLRTHLPHALSADEDLTLYHLERNAIAAVQSTLRGAATDAEWPEKLQRCLSCENRVAHLVHIILVARKVLTPCGVGKS